MKPLIEKTWDSIKVGAQTMCNEDKNIYIDNDGVEKFENAFKRHHAEVLEYMEDKEKPLDRHKIAAIIIISVIETDILQTENKQNIFTGNYVLAVEVALSYMLGELNEKLLEKDKSPLEAFFFPDALSCGTSYFRIFYRNLYFANNNSKWGLNPLDIAERLFLLEYMTLEKNGINPNTIREY